MTCPIKPERNWVTCHSKLRYWKTVLNFSFWDHKISISLLRIFISKSNLFLIEVILICLNMILEGFSNLLTLCKLEPIFCWSHILLYPYSVINWRFRIIKRFTINRIFSDICYVQVFSRHHFKKLCNLSLKSRN